MKKKSFAFLLSVFFLVSFSTFLGQSSHNTTSPKKDQMGVNEI